MNKDEIINLANEHGIYTDRDGDIYCSRLGALLVFAQAMRKVGILEAMMLLDGMTFGGDRYHPFKCFAMKRLSDLANAI